MFLISRANKSDLINALSHPQDRGVAVVSQQAIKLE